MFTFVDQIHGLLSTEFDDLSSLSDEEDEEYNEFKKFSNDCDNEVDYRKNPNDWSQHMNGFHNTSTPLHKSSANKSKTDFWTKSNGKYLNVSDILEEEEDVNEDKNINEVPKTDCIQTNGHYMDSRNSSLENGRTEQFVDSSAKKQILGANERSFSQRHVQLLIEENQRLSNELIVSQQKLSAINGNYEGLQYKLKDLEKINSEKENELIRLEGKIRSLEMNIKVENDIKEELQRKVSVCESTIESLEYQLMEIGKSDCLVRAQDTHESVVKNLKLKHENELILLNGEIEGLKHELNSKISEINRITKELNQTQCQNNESALREQLKDMIQVTKDIWEQEMKGRLESDIKSILESNEKKWAQSAEQKLINERNIWEQELQTEVLQVIEFLKMKAKLSADTLPDRVGLRFVPLLNLWHALEESCDSKEEELRLKIERLKEAKEQLEEALNNSRLNRSVSPLRANCSSNDLILSELRTELQKVSEEAVNMKEKLNKYKLHYHRLVKRHKQEIDAIKQEFADILQSLKQNFK